MPILHNKSKVRQPIVDNPDPNKDRDWINPGQRLKDGPPYSKAVSDGLDADLLELVDDSPTDADRAADKDMIDTINKNDAEMKKIAEG